MRSRRVTSLTMQLADFLDFDAIKTGLPGGNKRSLLQQLANLAGQRLRADSADARHEWGAAANGSSVR